MTRSRVMFTRNRTAHMAGDHKDCIYSPCVVAEANCWSSRL